MEQKFKWLFIIILILGCVFYFKNRAPESTEVRVRILANSDSLSDQQAKLKVKNILVSVLEEKRDATSIDIQAVREELLMNITDPSLRSQIRVEFKKCPFPAKSYQEKFLPAGNYKTLLVTIGQGVGRNWWSVLYPEFFGVSFEDDEITYRSYLYDKFLKK